jgi:hypothetical protein
MGKNDWKEIRPATAGLYSVDNGYLGIFLSHEIIKTKLMEVPHVKTQITRRMGRNH